jgi:sugar O-acyltransferase (sialic acid O-acetyltransferase NeuD family)
VSKIIKKHFFIGDGDFGQEIFLWRNFYNTINFSGFIDINKINNINLSREKSDYTITIGDPIIRDEIYRNFKKKNFYNKSIIFNNAVISKKVLIGAGSIIMSNAVISNNVKIGKNCHIHPNSVIGHNTIIGNSVTIGAGVFIGGKSIIKSKTTINPNSVIIKKIMIGSNCNIGSGSVIISNVNNNSSMFGVPAVKIK